MTVVFEADFPTAPCEALIVTWQPHSAATQPLDHFKQIAIDKNGVEVPERLSSKSGEIKTEEPMIRPKQKDETCGSCYGAAEESCCDSCADVFLAYRLRRWSAPMPEHVKQCEGVTKVPEIHVSPWGEFAGDKVEIDKLRAVADYGCRLVGQATVNRSPGTLHVTTAGVSRHTWQAVMGTSGSLKHVIRRFSVSEGQQKGHDEDALEMIVSDDTLSHQYYLTLVSVNRKSEGVTDSYKIIPKYFPVTKDPLGPGVHFRFDFDPLKMIVSDERNFAASLVDWLGFFGGLIAVTSIFL
jgi:hypothetical protein